MYEIKIYTEDVGNVAAIVAKRFDGFTLKYGRGYWEGASENSVVIVLVTPSDSQALEHAMIVAENIKRINEQDAVLVTWCEVKGKLI